MTEEPSEKLANPSLRDTHRVNNAAQPLKDENGRPVVVQAVTLCRLDAHRHESLGLRLRPWKSRGHRVGTSLYNPDQSLNSVRFGSVLTTLVSQSALLYPHPKAPVSKPEGEGGERPGAWAGRHTCGHVLQHLQQHVLCFIDQLGPLHHQLPEAQVPVEHCTHKAALEVPLNGLHLHKGG